MENLAIFCSGSGTNAEALMAFFQGHSKIRVSLLVHNRKEAGAKQRAEKYQVPAVHITSMDFQEKNGRLSEILEEKKIDFILLAGFLLLVPDWLVHKFPDRILNIHPALIPDFCGKGMFGLHVHKAVKESKVKETGMTIHLVNEEYDRGKILFQATCPVLESDSENDIAGRVLHLEHLHYPLVAEQFILKKS